MFTENLQVLFNCLSVSGATSLLISVWDNLNVHKELDKINRAVLLRF